MNDRTVRRFERKRWIVSLRKRVLVTIIKRWIVSLRKRVLVTIINAKAALYEALPKWLTIQQNTIWITQVLARCFFCFPLHGS
jgi:hypothetical protein